MMAHFNDFLVYQRDRRCISTGKEAIDFKYDDQKSFEAVHTFPLVYEGSLITIQPNTRESINSTQNGLLLRSDIHQHFGGYTVSINPGVRIPYENFISLTNNYPRITRLFSFHGIERVSLVNTSMFQTSCFQNYAYSPRTSITATTSDITDITHVKSNFSSHLLVSIVQSWTDIQRMWISYHFMHIGSANAVGKASTYQFTNAQEYSTEDQLLLLHNTYGSLRRLPRFRSVAEV